MISYLTLLPIWGGVRGLQVTFISGGGSHLDLLSVLGRSDRVLTREISSNQLRLLQRNKPHDSLVLIQHTHTRTRGNMRRHSNVRVKWAEADLETVNSAPHLSVKVTSNRFTLFSVNHFVTSAPLKRSEQRRAASRRQSPGCLIKSHKLPLNFPEVRFTVEAGSRVTFR